MERSALPPVVPLVIMKPINPTRRKLVRRQLSPSEKVVLAGAILLRVSGGREMLAHRRMTRRRKMTALARARRRIQNFSPYLSLFLLSVPIILVEPLKIVSLYVAGKGHWLTGTGIIIGAYALSLFFVERLFRAVKPKLLMLGWFAKLWTLFTAVRTKAIQWASGRRLPTDEEQRAKSAIAIDPAFID
jgi:hypothetical protein